MGLRWMTALMACLIALCAPNASRAQYMDRSGRSEWSGYGWFYADVDILPSDARMVPFLLRMNADQRASFDDLFQTYLTQRLDAGRRYVEYYDAAWTELRLDQQNEALHQQYRDTNRRFKEHAKVLRNRLMDDARLLLGTEQDTRWSILERALVRQALARAGMDAQCPAHRADVTRLALLAMRDREPTPELSDALDRFERDVGVSVNAYQAWQKEIAQGKRDFEVRDGEDAEAVYRFEVRKRIRAIADANVQHAERVARTMPGESA